MTKPNMLVFSAITFGGIMVYLAFIDLLRIPSNPVTPTIAAIMIMGYYLKTK